MDTKSVKSHSSFVPCPQLRRDYSLFASKQLKNSQIMDQLLYGSDYLSRLGNSQELAQEENRRRQSREFSQAGSYIRDQYVGNKPHNISLWASSGYGVPIPVGPAMEVESGIFAVDHEQEVPEEPVKKPPIIGGSTILFTNSVKVEVMDTKSQKSERKSQDDGSSEINSSENQGTSRRRRGIRRKNQQPKNDTKNLLRNFSQNAHQYMRFNERGRGYLDKLIQNSRQDPQFVNKSHKQIKDEFDKYLSSLSNTMKNFKQYQKTWRETSTFAYFYRYLTLKFYMYESPCYFWKTRLTNKPMHIQYIPYFINGILDPDHFDRFK